MSKHKLYVRDSSSPFDSSESSSPESYQSYLVSNSNFISYSKGEEKKNSLTSGANINMKKTKFDADAPGPSSVKDYHPALISNPMSLKRVTEKPNVYTDSTTGQKNPNCDPSNSPEVFLVSDFDSDVVEVDFFSKFNQKLPYSKQEDEMILRHVLQGQNIFKVGSLSLWKHLEYKKENPKRTYQSLKNRFLRNIKPYLFTTFRHLITNKETIDNILIKFPELKKQMGVKDTFSKITFPARKSPSNFVENAIHAGIDFDEHQENIERASSTCAVESKVQFDPVVLPNQESSQLNPSNDESFHRKVNFGKKTILVTVNFKHRNHLAPPVSSLIKINERFTKLRTKGERNFCPACGRYNRQYRESDFSESGEESDSMIPNSVDEGTKSPKSKLKNKNLKPKLNNNQKTNCQIPSSEQFSNQNSESLLNYDGKQDNLDKRSGVIDEDNSNVSDHSNPLILRNETIKVENFAEEIQVQEELESTISKRKANLETDKLRDSDSEIDIIYESTVAGFRKLIDAEEEKLLFRKCLYKNRDSIGFNSDSEKNLDSYFLESSPEVETPTLTENYSTLTQNNIGKTDFRNASSSHLASNMIKMLTKEKDKNKKF